MSQGNNVRIEQEDHRTARVYVDGNELKGVQHVGYRIGLDEIPIITVEFIPETLNFDKEEKTEHLIAEIKIDSDVVVEKVIEKMRKRARLQCKREVIL